MASIGPKDTRPELAVRRLVHRMGYRYRKHVKGLPGTPDLVFRARGKIILINGCFWHGHSCRRGTARPKSNVEYWNNKIARNMERDRQQLEKLRDFGWEVCIIWECEIKDIEALARRLKSFLGPTSLSQSDPPSIDAGSS